MLGTKGTLRLSPAYDFAADLMLETTVGKRTRQKTFSRSDQVAPEIVYFSSCVLDGNDPEPSGQEGLNDILVIEALYRSADSGERVHLAEGEKAERPSGKQKLRKPAKEEPESGRGSAAHQGRVTAGPPGGGQPPDVPQDVPQNQARCRRLDGGTSARSGPGRKEPSTPARHLSGAVQERCP